MIQQIAGAGDTMVATMGDQLYVRSNYTPNTRWRTIARPPNCGGINELLVVQHGALRKETLIVIYGYDATGLRALWQGEPTDIAQRGGMAWDQVTTPNS